MSDLVYSIYNLSIRKNYLKITTSLLFLFLAINQNSKCQNIKYRNQNTYNFTIQYIKSISAENNNNNIVKIVQGNNNIYIATKNDLYLFDSKLFTRVLHNVKNDGKKLELTDLITFGDNLIIATKKNGIWIYKNGNIENLAPNTLYTKNITFIKVINNELFYYKKSGETYSLDLNKKIQPTTLPIKIVKHHNNGNICTVISDNRKLYKLYNSEFNYLNNIPFSDFEETLYLGNKKNVFLKNKSVYFVENNKTEKVKLPKNISVFSIKMYNKQNILLFTSAGCYMLDTVTKIIYPFHKKFNHITGDYIFVDNDKNIWIYDNENGLILLGKNGLTYIRPYNITDFEPQQIEYLKSQIFVQTKNQNYILDIAYNHVPPVGLPQNSPIDIIHRYKNEKLWVSIDNRLFYSNKLPIFNELKLPRHISLADTKILYIFQQNDIYLWLLTDKTLFRLTIGAKLDTNELQPILSNWYIKYASYNKSKGFLPANLNPILTNNKFLKMINGENEKICVVYEDKILMQYGQFFRPIYTFLPDNKLLSIAYSKSKDALVTLTKKGIFLLRNGTQTQVQKWGVAVPITSKSKLIIDKGYKFLSWQNNNALIVYNTSNKTINSLNYSNEESSNKPTNDILIKNKLIKNDNNDIIIVAKNDIILYNNNILEALKNENRDKKVETVVDNKQDKKVYYFQLSIALLVVILILSTSVLGINLYIRRNKAKSDYLKTQNKKYLEIRMKKAKKQNEALKQYKYIFWIANYIISHIIKNSLINIENDNMSSEEDENKEVDKNTILMINNWLINKYEYITLNKTKRKLENSKAIVGKFLQDNLRIIQKSYEDIVSLTDDKLKVDLGDDIEFKNIEIYEIEMIIALFLTFIHYNKKLRINKIYLKHEHNKLKLEFTFFDDPFHHLIAPSDIFDKEIEIELRDLSIINLLKVTKAVININKPKGNSRNSTIIGTTKHSISIVWDSVDSYEF